MPVPVLREIIRQHAEQAAFLWTIYDRALLFPDENPEMDAVRIARVVERLEAHLDGLRVAGQVGREIADERYAKYPEAGELFVVRMLSSERSIMLASLDLSAVRRYLLDKLRSGVT